MAEYANLKCVQYCRDWCEYRYLDLLCCKYNGYISYPLCYCSTTPSSQFNFRKTPSSFDCTDHISINVGFLLYLSGNKIFQEGIPSSHVSISYFGYALDMSIKYECLKKNEELERHTFMTLLLF